jgi:hypothetical protein
VRQLICPWPKPPPCSASSVTTNRALSSVVPPLEGGLLPNSLAPPNTVIYIDILPEGLPENTRCGITSSPWPDVGDGAIIHASDHPRCLRAISPTVSFTAPSPLIAHSRFTVRAEDAVLHAETVPLVLVVDKAPQPAAYLYSTQLVPKYWNVLVDGPGMCHAFSRHFLELAARLRYHWVDDFARGCTDRNLVSPLFGGV